MTAIEELLESTLNRAASEVGAPAGLADHAVAAAGRIQRRRRAAGATSVAAIAVAAVAIAAVTGSSGERRATPIESPTPVTSVSATNLISGSPAPSETDSPSTTHRPLAVSALADLHVLFAVGTTIHDGTKIINLQATLAEGTSIQGLARLGQGYLVTLESPTEQSLATADRAGNLHVLDHHAGKSTGGGHAEVSSDGKTIAFARWATTSKGIVSTLRVIDTSGHLLHTASKNGPYLTRAVYPGEVWLTSMVDDAAQPPAVWDLVRNTVEDVSVGPQTTIDAVDLIHGRLVLGSGDCGTNVVSTSQPHKVVGHRCGVMAVNFSPDGSLILAEKGNGSGTEHLYALDSQDLSTQWSNADLPFYSVSSWTSDGRLIGYDLMSRIVIIDPKAKTVTVERVGAESDDFLVADRS